MLICDIRIGELSLLKNMMETMEVLGVDPQDEVESEVDIPSTAAPASDPSGKSPTSGLEKEYQFTPRPQGSPRSYPAITAGPQTSSGDSGLTSAESRDNRGNIQKKRKGLTPEQKLKLDEMQKEQEAIRKERVANLSQKLLDKISVWTETDRSAAVTDAFQKKMQVCYFVYCC
jgi:hypothetical protein